MLAQALVDPGEASVSSAVRDALGAIKAANRCSGLSEFWDDGSAPDEWRGVTLDDAKLVDL
jgi:hypothetical protein